MTPQRDRRVSTSQTIASDAELETGELREGRESLGRRATRGALWVALGYGGSQLIRFVGNLILTRLLFEEAFGLMALIASVLSGLELFSDIGIGPSIIQNEREDARFVNTAFTVQVGRGVGLWLVACALAVPFSWMYDEPQLAWLLPLCALNAVAAGASSTKLFTLNRELSLGRVEIVQVVAQLAGLIVMVTWALRSPSVLALVAGSLATGLVRMAMTHLYLPGAPNRFAWDRSAVREIIRFGRWIFVSTVLTFLAGQSDRLVFGKMVSMDLLGVYSIGMTLAMLPPEVISKLCQRIVFPLFSRVRASAEPLGPVFARVRMPILVLAGWGCSGLLAGGPTGVELLYDPRYHAAGWIIQLLAVAAWSGVLSSIYAAALLAHGQPKWVSAGSAAKLVGMAALIPGGYLLGRSIHPDWAFPGAVAGFALSEPFRYAAIMLASRRHGLKAAASDAQMTSLVLGVGLSGAAAGTWMEQLDLHVALRAAILAAGVTAFWLPMAWPHAAPRIRALLSRATSP